MKVMLKFILALYSVVNISASFSGSCDVTKVTYTSNDSKYTLQCSGDTSNPYTTIDLNSCIGCSQSYSPNFLYYTENVSTGYNNNNSYCSSCVLNSGKYLRCNVNSNGITPGFDIDVALANTGGKLTCGNYNGVKCNALQSSGHCY